MSLSMYQMLLRWESVPGTVTGWEIRKNGVKVATAGAKSRTTKVGVSSATTIEVIDLPRSSTVQEIILTQAAA